MTNISNATSMEKYKSVNSQLLFDYLHMKHKRLRLGHHGYNQWKMCLKWQANILTMHLLIGVPLANWNWKYILVICLMITFSATNGCLIQHTNGYCFCHMKLIWSWNKGHHVSFTHKSYFSIQFRLARLGNQL